MDHNHFAKLPPVARPSGSNEALAQPQRQAAVSQLNSGSDKLASDRAMAQSVDNQKLTKKEDARAKPLASKTAQPAAAARTKPIVVNRSAPMMNQVVRHQQQRLLLLRHAAKCSNTEDTCSVTPHCAGMKKLWTHIAECKDRSCLTPHCVSSRYVLGHYKNCRDLQCIVCLPVKKAIQLSRMKDRQVEQMRSKMALLNVTTDHDRAEQSATKPSTTFQTNGGASDLAQYGLIRNRLQNRILKIALSQLTEQQTKNTQEKLTVARDSARQIEAKLFNELTFSAYSQISDQALADECTILFNSKEPSMKSNAL